MGPEERPCEVNQTFGFILTPREDRIFAGGFRFLGRHGSEVMPIACAAFRGQLPPRGTALKFKEGALDGPFTSVFNRN